MTIALISQSTLTIGVTKIMRLFYINHSDNNDEISPLLITKDSTQLNGNEKIAVVLTKNYSGHIILINGQKIDADFSVSTFAMGNDQIESFLSAETADPIDASSFKHSNGLYSTPLGDAKFDIYEMMDCLQ
jgi:hypothetical protein